jgi:hypothetical protein
MPITHSTQPRQFHVQSEYDVIVMRQEVRQVARGLGLELSQQAKIATAMSTVARALVASNYSTTMHMRADYQEPRPALEISYQLSTEQAPETLAQLEQTLYFRQARALVDDAWLALADDGALLILRMWIKK